MFNTLAIPVNDRLWQKKFCKLTPPDLLYLIASLFISVLIGDRILEINGHSLEGISRQDVSIIAVIAYDFIMS